MRYLIVYKSANTARWCTKLDPDNLTYSSGETINFHLIYSVSKRSSGIHGIHGCHYTKLRDNYCYRGTLITRGHRCVAPHNSSYEKRVYTLKIRSIGDFFLFSFSFPFFSFQVNYNLFLFRLFSPSPRVDGNFLRS